MPAAFDATFAHPDAAAARVTSTTPRSTVAEPSSGAVPATFTAPDAASSAPSDALPAVSLPTSGSGDVGSVGLPPSQPAGAIAPAGPPLPTNASLVPRRSLRRAAAVTRIDGRRQLLLGLVFTALCAWAWEAMQDGGGLLGGDGPILSLYSPAPQAQAGPTARSPRQGRPPSLR